MAEENKNVGIPKDVKIPPEYLIQDAWMHFAPGMNATITYRFNCLINPNVRKTFAANPHLSPTTPTKQEIRWAEDFIQKQILPIAKQNGVKIVPGPCLPNLIDGQVEIDIVPYAMQRLENGDLDKYGNNGFTNLNVRSGFSSGLTFRINNVVFYPSKGSVPNKQDPMLESDKSRKFKLRHEIEHAFGERHSTRQTKEDKPPFFPGEVSCEDTLIANPAIGDHCPSLSAETLGAMCASRGGSLAACEVIDALELYDFPSQIPSSDRYALNIAFGNLAEASRGGSSYEALGAAELPSNDILHLISHGGNYSAVYDFSAQGALPMGNNVSALRGITNVVVPGPVQDKYTESGPAGADVLLFGVLAKATQSLCKGPSCAIL